MKQQIEFKGYWYFYIHSKLKERSINNQLNLNEAKSFLFEWRVPKWLRPVVLKEMENMELIKLENRNTIIFNKCDIDIDNISNIFNNVGLFEC